MFEPFFINPFSNQARSIISTRGDISMMDQEIDQLKHIVEHTFLQNTDSDTDYPLSIKDLAIKRFEWYLFRQFKSYDEKNFKYLFNQDIQEYDLLAFYLLCQAVAIGYGEDSHQAKLVIESQKALIDTRLKLFNQDVDDLNSPVLSEILNQFINTENCYWIDLKDLLNNEDIKLDELLIKDGRVIIEYPDFNNEFEDVIEGRSTSTMYNALCGNKLKIKLIRDFVSVYTREYIKNVSQKSKFIDPSPIIMSIAESIKELESKAQQEKFSNSETSGNINDFKPVEFNYEAFPPCVKRCLSGIKSGARNDAIVLFLTPFISYARLYPGVFSQDDKIKISDVDSDYSITEGEVIPTIYDAASKCRPPLFSDQPQEKININSKLGFGLNKEISFANEGETDWYTPMSCEKTKLHMSTLCHPNMDCKKIGNPLTYYNRKRFLESKTQKRVDK